MLPPVQELYRSSGDVHSCARCRGDLASWLHVFADEVAAAQQHDRIDRRLGRAHGTTHTAGLPRTLPTV